MRRILIANRGEVAVRIVRAVRDAGLASVAVYANSDRDALHVRLADESWPLAGSAPSETYLSIEALLAAARHTGADSVHPGYGFLAENAGFAEAVIDAGLTWIGPPPQAISQLGDKVTARQIAMRAGAPLVPGTGGAVSSAAEITAFAREHGLPVAIKAAFGGGGRGLRVAWEAGQIPHCYDAASREALAAFGRAECYAERYLDQARHVEAQVLADLRGRIVVLGTRDCTLQRRHQKLVEEAPAPFLTPEQCALIHESAKAICREVGYAGAGTVEYLLGRDGTLSFLEVNTRLQVEHPVTEETTGIDLVRETLRIAAGEPLRVSADPPARGHAFEFRINAEDPGRGFLPSPGTVTSVTFPGGPGVRVDSGIRAGDAVDGRFDSLMAKLIVTGSDRTEALQRSRRALRELEIGGIPSVADFHRAVVSLPAFAADSAAAFTVHTRWIETEFVPAVPAGDGGDQAAGGEDVDVLIGGRPMRVRLPGLPTVAAAGAIGGPGSGPATTRDHPDTVLAPMQGTVIKVAVGEGQQVGAGDVIAVVEAMKMENPVTAPKAGTVTALRIAVGDTTAQDQVICRLT
ncbi:MAG: acetyl/propionyl/methylcrotonyl-CoA carboxylase subunit alpha [Micromonosporaceae bacterium]